MQPFQCFNLNFRALLNENLKLVLTEYHRNRRAQISQVNIKVNFIAWLVEFLGCMAIWLDTVVVGSHSNVISLLLETLILLWFFILLPSTYLVNSSAGINSIVDHSWTGAFAKIYESPDKIVGKNTPSNQKQVSKVKTTSIFIISGQASDETIKRSNETITSTKGKQNTPSRTVPKNKRMRKLAWMDVGLEDCN